MVGRSKGRWLDAVRKMVGRSKGRHQREGTVGGGREKTQ